MKMLLIAWMVLSTSCSIYAQNITGYVYEVNTTDTIALSGALVQWKGTSTAALSGEDGRYELSIHHHLPHELVASFAGYSTQTIQITEATTAPVNFYLQAGTNIDAVTVEGSELASDIDPFAAQKLEVLSANELLKAACCNLSESFENNATIDVSFNDAVTGSKQITLLGLDGTYTQFNWENMPLIRGLGEYYGLNFVPGTAIESIQIGKGAGSVINGYESMAGQINVELQKPDTMDKLYLNGYQNVRGRTELNIQSGQSLNPQWSTGLFVHGNLRSAEQDGNDDTFLDMTKGGQINVFNRWKYVGKNNLRSQFGAKYLYDEQIGGQLQFDKDQAGTSTAYGTFIQSHRAEAFAKTGLIFPEQPYKSVGLIINASRHTQEGFYGNQAMQSSQNSLYANLIGQTVIENSNHTVKYGGNFQYDDIEEQFIETTARREVSVPGAFLEYNYNNQKNINLIAGFRGDYLNVTQSFELSPRIHLKWTTDQENSLRLSAGRGFRVPTLFADNPNVLVSSRSVIYGDLPNIEQSWNYGANLTRYFQIGQSAGTFSTDFYRTVFQEQLVADRFSNAQEVRFNRLEGDSYSNSFQAQVSIEPAQRLEIRAAYKRDDVKQSIQGEVIERELVPKHRGLLNFGYALPFNRMTFDVTGQYVGEQRLPATAIHPNAFENAAYSDDYFRMIAQVSRKIRDWEVYVGGENLTNFKQENPIIGANDPFGVDFDASVVWAPIQGPNIYGGFRYRIKQEQNEK